MCIKACSEIRRNKYSAQLQNWAFCMQTFLNISLGIARQNSSYFQVSKNWKVRIIFTDCAKNTLKTY